MPKKKLDIDISLWQTRIGDCENFQSSKHNEWTTANKLFTGTFFGFIGVDSELSEVNFTYEFIKMLIGSCYARDPHIFSRPFGTGSRYALFAESMETVINYYWRKLKLKKKMKQALLNAAMNPPGFIRIGYKFLESRTDENKEESQQGELMDEIQFDDIFAEFLSTWDVLFPEGYHDFRNCPYVIIKEKITLEDLLRRTDFDQSVVNQLTSGYAGTPGIQTIDKVKPYTLSNVSAVNTSGMSPRDKEKTIKTLYHVFDRRNRIKFTIVKGFNGGTLYEREWDDAINGFSIYELIFNEIPQTEDNANAYPLSDIVPMIPQLKELSLISTSMNKHRKRSGTVIFAKEDDVSETQATNIQNANDLSLIRVPRVDETAIKGFTPPPLPNDFYRLRMVILEDLMRISGYNQLLGSARGVETATESENVRAGALIRQGEKIDQVEDFAVEVAIGLAGFIWQYVSRKKIADILGIDEKDLTEELWPNPPDDPRTLRYIIQNQIILYIEAGSTRPPKDEAVERKQWMDLVAMIKAMFPDRFRDDIILRQILKKFDFKDIELAIKSYDEEEMKAAQEENKLLVQNIPCVVSPNNNHKIHLMINGGIYNVPGIPKTAASDQHLMSHVKFMQQQSPTALPQKGDTKPQGTKGTPDIARKGVADFSDIVGGIASTNKGTGANIGG